MNRIRTALSSRVFIATAFAVIAIMAYVASVPTADAVICPGITTYYKDATYRKVIGARGTGCCGAVINWGQTSAYVRCEVVYCTDQVCPN